MTHWHAFAYNGHSVPPDSAARDLNQPVPPREIRRFFAKPASMCKAVFTEPDSALDWLKAELKATPPLPTDLPIEAQYEYSRDCLDRITDAYVGYYTASGFMVRALLTCTRETQQCSKTPA